ncbi:MFS transporter [Bordetella bronchiseptica]|uniref:MFS transporter n=1 Tax=Bordetella bronchiseptica TaxID=518 RepID=UPI00045A0D00|nr:MFS transporter [Bordetella bronchiseptica]KAK49932.1 transporter, major facilitator family protein [Bordetella bronchiseptica OSU054]KCV31879.1 transporter, major facilitator family protein [Bordetella bronchiseptica 00-P-2730]KDB74993.1 transporter, major facilitator family protein [Bordetella bronchiseptica CA90 BB1334]KDD41663.1 transporter, major facilitator family protein [Bordetella bronchiseptica OSU095]
MPGAPVRVVGILGTAQTLAWASSYYLPAMLADPMARDLGVSTPTVYAAFSAALVASALIGPWAGLAIDRHGGRMVLAGTSLLFALGLGMLGAAQGLWTMVAAWLVMGVAMGAGLYEAAFSSLVRLYGHHARGAITGITLIAGFASTVGWPLSAWMETLFGWRGACLGWAALHLMIGLPLNAWLPKAVAAETPGPDAPAAQERSPPAARPGPQGLATALLAFVFAATWFISTAMATHLPRMLQATGATLAAAVAVGALIGPAQVAGRLLEFGLLRHVHPLLSARLAALAHPAGVAVLLTAGPALAPLFAILHGAGNGILTIAKGTLPLALFGPQGYGARQGWLMMPARVAQALAPFLFGLALDAWRANALWLSGGIGLAACAALLVLRARPDPIKL